MSSQAVAASMRGLPDHHSPPEDLRNFSESTWSAERPEGQTNPQTNLDDPTNKSRDMRTASWSSVDVDQRNRAVGNLLAALAPVPVSQSPQADLPTMSQSNDNEEFPDIEDSADQAESSKIKEESTAGDAEVPPLPPLGEMEDLEETSLPQESESEVPLTQPMSEMGFGQTRPGEPIDNLPHTPINSQHVPDRREIEAFAKIEFEDGNYYITTYACELGRDALAYKAALARAEEAKNTSQGRAQSSSGRVSRPSDRVRRHGDSQVHGSVVSEAGGFGGVDDGPHPKDKEKGEHTGDQSMSSQVSAGSVVKPQEVLINPPLIPFDYHKNAERQAQMDIDNEQPAPVTADHLPKADTCPLIPIHATTTAAKSEVETHKGISRRHVKIEWDWDKECFQMRVLGRNGAFLDGVYIPQGISKSLSHGSKIQISDVLMTFRLPRPKTDPMSEDSDREIVERSPDARQSTSPTSNDADSNGTPIKSEKSKTTITFKSIPKPSMSLSDPVGPDGLPMQPRKRGPGRPPKDGIMSTRERREREKALKLAEAKAANGGKTPPPMIRGKFPKPIAREESVKIDVRPEKRKYKKRKRVGEDGEIIQSIEGGDGDVPSDVERGPVKKSRASKSPSPEYPPADTLTEEQLARPSEPYARLIYDILIDIHPKALPLKQIYRALKLKFPFFVHRVDSEGWQSSVRHNLNQEWNKLFEKGEKEGKGFAWKAIPGALQPQAERKRAAQAAAAAKPKPPPTPRNQPNPHGPPPPLNWQNSTPFPPQNGMPPRGHPPPFFQPGGHPPMPPPNGMPWPPPPGSMPPTGPPPGNPPGQIPPGQNAPPFPPPPPGQQPFHPPTPQTMPPRPPSAVKPPAPPQSQTPTGTPTPQQSSTTPNPPPPPPSTSSSSSRNMPCTTEGLLAIRRFEVAMYNQVGPQGNIEYWQGIFASVRSRLLHGAAESSMPGGETKEEKTIMDHVRVFIERFKNPNFEGHSLNPSHGHSRTASPAVIDGKATEKPAQPTSAQNENDNAKKDDVSPATNEGDD